MSANTSDPKVTVLKKYPNRRLYDPSRNCHVTLEEVADRVKAGEQIRIVDNKTGEDLTHVTMGQVLFETLKARPDYLPLDLVLLMIRAQDNLVRGFLYNALPQAFQMYVEQQRRMMSGLNWLSPGYQGFSNPFPNFFGTQNSPAPTQPPPDQTPGDGLKEELERLRKEVDGLKTGLGKTSEIKGKPRKKRAS